jgi:hypothetical protein
MTSDQGFGVLAGMFFLGAFLTVFCRTLTAPLPTATPPAVRVSAGAVRTRGTSALGEGVALWWPTPGAGGEVTCVPCIASGAWAAADLRPDDDRALVQRGDHARRRAEVRCAVHAGRLVPR